MIPDDISATHDISINNESPHSQTWKLSSFENKRAIQILYYPNDISVYVSRAKWQKFTPLVHAPKANVSCEIGVSVMSSPGQMGGMVDIHMTC